jgi:hypothetical protein
MEFIAPFPGLIMVLLVASLGPQALALGSMEPRRLRPRSY